MLAFSNDNTQRLYNSITDEYTLQEPFFNWNKLTSVAEWNGVSVENGHVTKLAPYTLYLTKVLSEELANLSELKILNLNGHSLKGTIPKELGQLSKLEVLDLGNVRGRKSSLAGKIPKELGNLSNLKMLKLDHNHLTGEIPQELTKLLNLKELDVRFNSLLGSVPSFDNTGLIMGISNNGFIFKNLEVSYVNNNYDYGSEQFISPQAVVDSNRTELLINGGATVEIVPQLEENPSGNNAYQWYKDGVELVAATNRVFRKENATKSDAGLYTYKVTNSVVTGLILESHTLGGGIGIDISNQAPLGITDEAETAVGTAISIDVLSNDVDADSIDDLEIAEGSLSTPNNGTVVVNEGRIDYTPNENFIGIDSFTYRVSDGTDESENIMVTVTVKDTVKDSENPFIYIQETMNKKIVFKTYFLGEYNVSIDWGDGTTSQNISSDTSHTYDLGGNKKIKISGIYPQPVFGSVSPSESANSLKSIEQWGNIKWKSMYGAFRNCKNLVINASDIPNFSEISGLQLEDMFQGATSFNAKINHWDVSTVTNMFAIFDGATSFNQPLNDWNVSNVQNMGSMFGGASEFNQPLEAWDVSNVTNMEGMFSGASEFNQPLASWDIKNVGLMRNMFANTESFNQPLDSWNVSNVYNMNSMFSSARLFNQPLNSWDVSNVKTMHAMFSNAIRFNQNLSSWDVSNIGSDSSYNHNNFNMKSMFFGASTFNQDISQWDISSVTSMNNMLKDTNLSTENYNKLLNAWSLVGAKNNITFSAFPTQYSTTASNARDILINTNNWTISDGGNKDELTSATKRLLAYYNFDDCTANDSSGNERHGTLHGVTCEETVSRGKAMRFDGDDSIDINVPINGSGDWSVCMWYNLDVNSPSGYKDLISGDHSFTLSIKDLSHEIYASFPKLSTDAKPASEIEGIDTLVCYVKADSNLSIYLNGGLEKKNINGTNISVENLRYIGRWSRSASEYFHGLLDEIKIYEGVLSETEIQDLFLESESNIGGELEE